MMKLSSGFVMVILGTCVAASRPCPENCRNSTLGMCNIDTGACFRGCVPGYYGNTCNMTCDANCKQGICQWIDGSCTCKPGYTFNSGSCDSKTDAECRSNDHCLNNKCVSAGRRNCLEGCKPGWFGEFCQQPCSPNCACDKESGNCTSCIPGWYGEECGSRCSKGCVDKKCDRVSAICTSCNPGWYGETCGALCSQGCLDKTCDRVSGICTSCNPGLYGVECRSTCSPGCVDKRCDRVSGICTSCIPGWYGVECGSTCSPGCVDKRCDRLSGICASCIQSWHGVECGSRCSQGCLDKNCHRNGTCVGGCTRGFYGEMCESTCPEDCEDGQCDTYGACITCRSGFYGTLCRQTCNACTNQVCEMITGECKDGCESGLYGSFCNLTCKHCEEGNCVQDTGECILKEEKGEKWSAVQSWVGGGVAIVIIIPVALGAFYMFRRLKRMNGVVYDIVKWRRPSPSAGEDVRPGVGPGYIELEDEISIHPPRVCPIHKARQTSYIEPQHSGGSGNNIQVQRKLQTAALSDQQEEEQQAAAVSPSYDVQQRSDESHDRPDSYVLPNYCEVNEELMATLPQAPQGAEAPAPVVNYSSFSVVADVHAQHEHRNDGNADLNIPLIADCFGPTETEDSPPDDEPRPDVENYEHPFKNHYTQF